MGDTHYTTAIALGLGSVASGVALRVVKRDKLSTEYPTWAFGTCLGCCTLGTLVYGVPQLNRYRRYYQRANFIMHCVVVPLLSVHFSIVNKYDTDISYLQFVFPIFPLVANILDDKHQQVLQDGVVGGTLAFQAFMHFQAKNYYGLAFCISYVICHFFIGCEGTVGEAPAMDLHAFGFIFNMFFALKSLYS